MSEAVDDFLVVGAGPAGTSAALALAEAGCRVRLVDAGTARISLPPPGDFASLRAADAVQWMWQIGAAYTALAARPGTSPKLRVPGFRSIFDGYAEANRIVGEDGFHVVGALAAGGLSNAWGCGVAAFDDEELDELGVAGRAQMRTSYARVATRMGISGASDDALTSLAGVDEWAEPGVELDALHARLWARRERLAHGPLRLGRARVAVITRPRAGREACDLSGMCLWGCARRATWSAALDADALAGHPGVRLDAGHVVERLLRDGDAWRLECSTRDGPRVLRARRVLLAAGTLASTRLALAALASPPREVRMLSNPMAAFLLLLPAALGEPRGRAFGLAQLAFAIEDARLPRAFGNLFSTAGLPLSEFLEHAPVSRAAALPLFRRLLPATVVANMFLPGEWSSHRVALDAEGALHVRAGFAEGLDGALAGLRGLLAPSLRRLGAWMLPGSFVAGVPGADIHYAATLPIRAHPGAAHECDVDGQVAGLPGVYAVDGASLPVLPAKAHTLSLMANADRIARGLAGRGAG